jgi:flagellar FliL protein
MSATEGKGKPEGEAKAQGKEAAEPGKSGGWKNWLPLLVTIVLMPVLAFITTNFLVLPKIVHARTIDAEDPSHAHGGQAARNEGGGRAEKKEEGGHGEKKEEGKNGKGAHGTTAKKRQNYQISKVIVNVAGSMGSRYLMTSFTLVGNNADFKDVLEENKDQLLDLANTSLASKSISDLEKPGARNQIRTELISIFNNALGGNYVQEIFFTEFAIQ